MRMRRHTVVHVGRDAVVAVTRSSYWVDVNRRFGEMRHVMQELMVYFERNSVGF